ncbi:MAG: thioredoxin domain-containing protein [Deltaproteobacteria bacterium]|nr:thioredoxin domain-containing protein [Deltaproteobacteria bacterium]
MKSISGIAVLAFLFAACKASPEANRDGRNSDGARGARARVGSASDEPAGDSAVAKVGDTSITFATLLDKSKNQLGPVKTEYLTKRHEILKGALDEMVEQKLLDLEAKARSIDRGALLKAEVDSKVPAPSDDEIKKFYEMVKDRLEEPFDKVKPEITKYLQKTGVVKIRGEFLKTLRAKYKVELNLPAPEVPRVEVSEAGAPSMGPPNAPVKIIEFSDFECPFCSRGAKTIKEVVQKYGAKVRLAFRDYPLPFHQNAKKAHEAALCAHDQGKFWEMHDKLFDNQKALGVDALKGYAKELAIDTAKFNECLDSGKKGAIVEKGLEDGQKAGVNGTPAFFINGRVVSGAQPLEAFSEIIDAELARKPK